MSKITNPNVIDLEAKRSPRVIARVIGIAETNVSSAIGDGRISGETNGEVIRSYCERLRKQASGRGFVDGEDALDPTQESAKLKRSQTEGQEIKNAVARGEYAPIGLLTDTLAAAAAAVVTRFDQLESTLRKSCGDVSPEVIDVVRTVIANARNAWVDQTQSLINEQVDAEGDED